MQLDLTPIPIFSDNYVWTLSSTVSGCAVVVDPGDAGPVIEYLDKHSLKLKAILITHHHWDHVGGIGALKKHYGATVYGPARIAIEGVDVKVSEGDTISLPELGTDLEVLDLFGHTDSHVGYLGDGLLFCGDTLFSAGCGRLLDGTAAQLHSSLDKISRLPVETQICCTHEYTLNNLHFAAEVEPDNKDIENYIPEVENMMRQRTPSLPSTLEKEKQINPFLRTELDSVREAVASHVGRTIGDDLECFTELRKWKDSY